MNQHPQEHIFKPLQKKYLVNWTLSLGPEELMQISSHPEVLQKGLNYLTKALKQKNIEIYRIVKIEEIISHKSQQMSAPKSPVAKPHGIAIFDAASIEEARAMINFLAEGFGFGGISVENYLEFEISQLSDITKGGKM